MDSPPVDHRRAVAERNGAAIVAAIEELVVKGQRLTMQAIAAQAGVSRPTLYAHFATIGDVVEAAVAIRVRESVAAIAAAEPEAGPADEALERLVAASWGHVARFDALARAAAEYLPASALHRAHVPMMTLVHGLVNRGRREGVFRTDLPAEWLVTTYVALVHAADDHARSHSLEREQALAMLSTSIRDLFTAR
jgi:TetR/AcrR family transcriptional regulator, mexCD-oprJ operon repressor